MVTSYDDSDTFIETYAKHRHRQKKEREKKEKKKKEKNTRSLVHGRYRCATDAEDNVNDRPHCKKFEHRKPYPTFHTTSACGTRNTRTIASS